MKKLTETIESPVKGINQLSSAYKLEATEAQELVNVDLDSSHGVLSTRDLALYLSAIGPIPSGNEILATHFYELIDGSFYLIATDGVKIYASLSATGAWAEINTGKNLTAGKPIPTFLNVSNSLWITNGYDKVAEWKDATTYRYLDGAATAGTGTLVTTASANVVGTGTLANTEIAVGDTIIASDTQTRMVVSVTDNTHFRVDSAPSPDWAGATFTIRKTPDVPKGRFMAYDKSKVVMARIDTSPLSIRMSVITFGGIFINPDQSQAWPATEELIAPASYGASITGLALLKGKVTTLGVSQGRILLFKDSSMYTLSGSTISDFRFDILSNSIGTRYSKTIEYLEDGSIGFAAELGLYRTDGDDITRFSDKIESTYLALSRKRTTVQAMTYSLNFDLWTFTNTEVVNNSIRLSGSSLTGSAVSANTQIIGSGFTAKQFLDVAIQQFDDDETILVEMKVAATSVGLGAATYHTIEDSEIPTDTINIWIKVRVTLTRATTAKNPILTFVQINYEEYVLLNREPFLIYNSDELLFGLDTEYLNLRAILNRQGAWTLDLEETVLISCGTRYRGVVYLGASNGRVYSLYAEQGADDTLDISARWKTKPVTNGLPDRVKSLDYIILYTEGDAFKIITLEFLIDGVMRRTEQFMVSESNLRDIKLWMPQGLLYKTLEITFKSQVRQKISKIGRMDLHSRLLETEEAN